jgi:WD40 repeat protein
MTMPSLPLRVLAALALAAGALGPAAAQRPGGRAAALDPVLTIELNGIVHSIAFAPDGKTLATASSDRLVRLWDAATGEERRTLRGHLGNVSSVAFAPDGKTLASGSRDQTVRLWVVATGAPGVALDGQRAMPVSTTSGLVAAAFAPNGKTLASTDNGSSPVRSDGVIHLWDPATGQKKASLRGHGGPVLCLAWAPDGRTLTSGGFDKTVRFWELATGKERFRLTGQVGAVQALAYAPDGKTLAISAHDQSAADGRAEVKLWDVARGKARVSVPGHGSEGPVAFSPDGRWLACPAKGGGVRLLAARTGEEKAHLATPYEGVNCLAFTRDGKRLAAGHNATRVSVWDLARLQAAPQGGRP